jgi:tRNA modification GTPase
MAGNFFRSSRPFADEPARKMILGNILDGEEIVDQVLAVRFESGASYTGEESVEIHCHGGVCAARRCVDVFLRAGARTAMPGEFTKRAFLNGRMDLAQAEAVLGVIKARSDAELISSGRALQGELSALLRELSNDLTRLRAGIEARIDFPDDVDGSETDSLASDVREIRTKISSLLDRCRVGLTLKNGVRAAIVGRPNAGKSSLLNAMLGIDRAIVTDIPGTTRDTLDAALIHKGLQISLIDTAGMRDIGHDAIENMGMERSRKAASGADFCVLVIDASEELTEYDRLALETSTTRPTLLVLNKCDLARKAAAAELAQPEQVIASLEISALTGEGIETVKDAIFEAALGGTSPSDGLLATERIVGALVNADKCAADAIFALESSRMIDAAGSLLSEASEHITSPLGGDASEELLDAIFSTFCIGK